MKDKNFILAKVAMLNKKLYSYTSFSFIMTSLELIHYSVVSLFIDRHINFSVYNLTNGVYHSGNKSLKLYLQRVCSA